MKRSLPATATMVLWALSAAAQAQTVVPQARPVTRPAPFATLGPLSAQVVVGQSGAWTVGDFAGQALLVNPAAAGAVRYYAIDWQGDLAAGRSVSVRVVAKGGAGISAAGLIFRLTNQDPRWVSYVLGTDGKLGLYVRRADALVRTGTYDLPGGHRPAGDVLSINQSGAGAQLLANGYLVAELTLPDGLKPNVPAPVGIAVMGTGEFTLGNFAFGKAITPAPSPGAAPPVVAGNDDVIPTPQAPVAPPAPTPVPAPAARPIEVASMGPLGHRIRIGDNQGWTISVDAGALVFTHQAEDDLYYFNRTVPANEATGASAHVTVEQHATSKNSGAGLVFGLTEGSKAFWALEATGDGKVKLFHLKDDEFNLVDTFETPNSGTLHALTMTKTDDGMALFADGKKLTVVEEDEPDGYDTDGRLGVSMRGNGRFAFRDFAFGPAEPSPSATPAPTSGATASSLGPLGREIVVGDSDGWATSVRDGTLTYAHPGDDTGGVLFRAMAWPTEASEGRSASVTVDATPPSGSGGTGGGNSGGGIAFAEQEDGRNMLLWAACGDGKVRLFRIEDDAASVVQAFTPARAGKRHALRVSQQDDQIRLMIDGKAVKTLAGKTLGGLEGAAGIGVLRGGSYTFSEFAFGPAEDSP